MPGELEAVPFKGKLIIAWSNMNLGFLEHLLFQEKLEIQNFFLM